MCWSSNWELDLQAQADRAQWSVDFLLNFKVHLSETSPFSKATPPNLFQIVSTRCTSSIQICEPVEVFFTQTTTQTLDATWQATSSFCRPNFLTMIGWLLLNYKPKLALPHAIPFLPGIWSQKPVKEQITSYSLQLGKKKKDCWGGTQMLPLF